MQEREGGGGGELEMAEESERERVIERKVDLEWIREKCKRERGRERVRGRERGRNKPIILLNMYSWNPHSVLKGLQYNNSYKILSSGWYYVISFV